MTTGEKIKKARKAAGFTQKELGEKLGITQSAVAMFENNRTNMKYSTLQKIADALNVPVVDLWDDDDLHEIEELDWRINIEGSVMSAARCFFSLLWQCERDSVNIDSSVDDNDNVKICVMQDNDLKLEFWENDFFYLMSDVFSYFKFKLQDVTKD